MAILPGNFELKALALITDIGEGYIDLIPRMWTQIHIFESILTPTITGYVSLTDHENIISGVNNALPIMGNELIYMEFKLPDYYVEDENGKMSEKPKENLIRFIGRVTDIKNKEIINDRSHNYEIHFSSEELILDRNIRISRSFKGKTISSIAKSVFDVFNSICKSEFEATAGTYDIIIPNWNPLKTLNWLASRGIPLGYPAPPMLFFQTLYTDDVPNTEQEIVDNNSLVSFKGEVGSKYWFTSLDYLLSYSPRKTFFFIPSKQLIAPVTQEQKRNYMYFSNVLNYRVIHSFDTLEANTTGLYNSTLITHDITTKSWSRNTFNYDDTFDNLNHTEKETPGKFFSGTKDILNKTFTSYKDSLYMMSSTGTPESPNNLSKISSFRNSRLSSLNNYKLELLVPGDGLVEAGDIINFKIPSPERGAEKGLYDVYYSGNYLVSAIRHIFSNKEYRIQMECVKESLKKDPRI
jgi:hypothetical protein